MPFVVYVEQVDYVRLHGRYTHVYLLIISSKLAWF